MSMFSPEKYFSSIAQNIHDKNYFYAALRIGYGFGALVIFFGGIPAALVALGLLKNPLPPEHPATLVGSNYGNFASGNSAPVTQVQNVNQLATYLWQNQDSWTPSDFGGAYGDGNYRTDLIFTATTPLLPNSVCEKIGAWFAQPGSIVSALSTGLNLGTRKSDGSVCFRDPSATTKIQLVTHGKPLRIQAELVNGQ